jgi:hypothetical protein
MANTALQKITTRAKQIRKASPNMAWAVAIKKASAEYRSGSIKKVKRAAVSGTRKKAPAKKVTRVKARTVVIAGPKKKSPARKKASTGFSIGAVAISQLNDQHTKKLRYEKELAAARIRKEKKSVIQALQKLISTTKQHITALKRSI